MAADFHAEGSRFTSMQVAGQTESTLLTQVDQSADSIQALSLCSFTWIELKPAQTVVLPPEGPPSPSIPGQLAPSTSHLSILLPFSGFGANLEEDLVGEEVAHSRFGQYCRRSSDLTFFHGHWGSRDCSLIILPMSFTMWG